MTTVPRTPGSMAMTIGLTVMLVSVSAAMHFSGTGGFGFLLCFLGVLVGANLATPTPIVPMVFTGAGALTAFLSRNAAVVGLVMASCAFTVVPGETANPLLCFAMLALLLLGISLINIGARGE